MSNGDAAKAVVVEDALRALFPEVEVEIHQYTPDEALDHGFSVFLPDYRHFHLVVSVGFWEDHTSEELAAKLAEPTVQEKLQDSRYKFHTLTNEAGLASEIEGLNFYAPPGR